MKQPSSFAAEITRQLVALRKEAGIRVPDLAERLGTTVQNVQRIERGQNITARTLYRFAVALGFDVKITFEPNPSGPRTPPPGKKNKKKGDKTD